MPCAAPQAPPAKLTVLEGERTAEVSPLEGAGDRRGGALPASDRGGGPNGTLRRWRALAGVKPDLDFSIDFAGA
jgi:hypothetical protein